jgi:hypothetical protein
MIVIERLIGEDLNLGIDDASVTHAGGGTLQGTQISLTTLSRAGPQGSRTDVSIDMGTIAALGHFTQEVAVPSAFVGDVVLVTLRPNPEGPPVAFDVTEWDVPALMLQAYVPSANSIVIHAFNPTSAVITPGTVTLSILIFTVR